MVVGVTGLALALEDAEGVGLLVGNQDVAGAVVDLVDRDAFLDPCKPVSPEERELQVGVRCVGVGEILVDPGGLIGVVDVAELVVDGDRLDLLLPPTNSPLKSRTPAPWWP